MNVFQLSALVTPFAGAISGGMAAKGANSLPVAAGAALGLLVGFAVLLVMFACSWALAKIFGLATQSRLTAIQWLASLTAAVLPGGAPFVAWPLAYLVVVRL